MHQDSSNLPQFLAAVFDPLEDGDLVQRRSVFLLMSQECAFDCFLGESTSFVALLF